MSAYREDGEATRGDYGGERMNDYEIVTGQSSDPFRDLDLRFDKFELPEAEAIARCWTC